MNNCNSLLFQRHLEPPCHYRKTSAWRDHPLRELTNNLYLNFQNDRLSWSSVIGSFKTLFQRQSKTCLSCIAPLSRMENWVSHTINTDELSYWWFSSTFSNGIIRRTKLFILKRKCLAVKKLIKTWFNIFGHSKRYTCHFGGQVYSKFDLVHEQPLLNNFQIVHLYFCMLLWFHCFLIFFTYLLYLLNHFL